MSESAGRVVGWQERYRKDGDGDWLEWRDCSEAYHHYSVNVLGPLPEYETRALVPEQLLVDCETQRDLAIASRDWNCDQRKKLEAAVRALADGKYIQTAPIDAICDSLRALTEKSEETR